jgi:hypothetical protein
MKCAIPLVMVLAALILMSYGSTTREAFNPWYRVPEESPLECTVGDWGFGSAQAPESSQEYSPEDLSDAVRAVVKEACSRSGISWSAGPIFQVSAFGGMFYILMMLFSGAIAAEVEVTLDMNTFQVTNLSFSSEKEDPYKASEPLAYDKVRSEQGYLTSLQRISQA